MTKESEITTIRRNSHGVEQTARFVNGQPIEYSIENTTGTRIRVLGQRGLKPFERVSTTDPRPSYRLLRSLQKNHH